MFEELKQSIKWMPPYEIMEKIRKEEQEIRKEAVKLAEQKGEKKGIKKGRKEGHKEEHIQGRIEEKVEMAIALKKRKIDLIIIVETSGLPIEEIEKL